MEELGGPGLLHTSFPSCNFRVEAGPAQSCCSVPSQPTPLSSTAWMPLCTFARGLDGKPAGALGSEQPHPSKLTLLPLLSTLPPCLSLSLFSYRAEPLASPLAPVWVGQVCCCLQPLLTTPSDLTINVAPPPPAACLWGDSGGGL